jgi:hypothetical protein
MHDSIDDARACFNMSYDDRVRLAEIHNLSMTVYEWVLRYIKLNAIDFFHKCLVNECEICPTRFVALKLNLCWFM